MSFFRRPFICPPYALHFPQRGKMRKILASIVIALLLTSCLLQFDPDYIPYNTIVHRPLGAGVYEAYTDDTHYELTIADGDHDPMQGVSCTLKLYRCNAYICAAEPYVTYKGTYRHYITLQNTSRLQVRPGIRCTMSTNWCSRNHQTHTIFLLESTPAHSHWPMITEVQERKYKTPAIDRHSFLESTRRSI